MSDKRRYHRIKIKIPLKFHLPLTKKEIDGSTINISGTGLAFSTKNSVAKGQKLLIKLFLPGGEEINIQAKTVWVKKVVVDTPPSQWFKVGVKIKEPLQMDEKKYLRFYSQELAHSCRGMNKL